MPARSLQASSANLVTNLFFNNSGWGWKHDGDIANYMEVLISRILNNLTFTFINNRLR